MPTRLALTLRVVRLGSVLACLARGVQSLGIAAWRSWRWCSCCVEAVAVGAPMHSAADSFCVVRAWQYKKTHRCARARVHLPPRRRRPRPLRLSVVAARNGRACPWSMWHFGGKVTIPSCRYRICVVLQLLHQPLSHHRLLPASEGCLNQSSSARARFRIVIDILRRVCTCMFYRCPTSFALSHLHSSEVFSSARAWGLLPLSFLEHTAGV